MKNRIIQFLHPGPEHGWDRAITRSTGCKHWNRGKHKRKFLIAEGFSTSTPTMEPVKGRFTFWSEWEPQSEVQVCNEKHQAGYPRWLHTPRLKLEEIDSLQRQGCGPCALGGPQNTDPLVFGDLFRYVLCQQYKKNTVNPTQLMQLRCGDIILFGSCVAQKFALDTAFVVEISAALRHGGSLPRWESELHKKITMDLFDIPRCGVRLYGSATWSSDRPFSFVPCLSAADAPHGFRRPKIEPIGMLSEVINPKLLGGHKITLCESREHLSAVWHEVVKQVLDQGCALGTSIAEPPDASSLTGQPRADVETVTSHPGGHATR